MPVIIFYAVLATVVVQAIILAGRYLLPMPIEIQTCKMKFLAALRYNFFSCNLTQEILLLLTLQATLMEVGGPHALQCRYLAVFKF